MVPHKQSSCPTLFTGCEQAPVKQSVRRNCKNNRDSLNDTRGPVDGANVPNKHALAAKSGSTRSSISQWATLSLFKHAKHSVAVTRATEGWGHHWDLLRHGMHSRLVCQLLANALTAAASHTALVNTHSTDAPWREDANSHTQRMIHDLKNCVLSSANKVERLQIRTAVLVVSSKTLRVRQRWKKQGEADSF